MAKSAKTKKEPTQEEIAVKVRVEPTDATPVFYVNYAEVSHNVNEFSVLCTRIPTKPDQATMDLVREKGIYSVEATASLIVPPTLMRGLIRAMQAQVDKYQEKFGRIVGEKEEDAEWMN
jgi:hypothetical protein